MAVNSGSDKKGGHRIEPKFGAHSASSKTDLEEFKEINTMQEAEDPEPLVSNIQDESYYEDEWDKPPAKPQSEHRKLFVGLLIVGVFFFSCVVWAVVLLLGGQTNKISVEDSVSESLSFDAKVKRRHQVVKEYLGATTIQEKALYVRDRERVLPLMENFYQKNRLVAEAINIQFAEKAIMGKDGIIWRVRVRDADTNSAAYLSVETSEEGISKVDWETDVNYQPSNLDSFKSSRSSQPHTFRALIQSAQLDGFHGFEFASYNSFRCFKVSFPDSEEYLWAFTNIGSKLDTKMLNLMKYGRRNKQNNKQAIPVILELRYPENGQSARCVHLSNLVQVGWMY